MPTPLIVVISALGGAAAVIVLITALSPRDPPHPHAESSVEVWRMFIRVSRLRTALLKIRAAPTLKEARRLALTTLKEDSKNHDPQH